MGKRKNKSGANKPSEENKATDSTQDNLVVNDEHQLTKQQILENDMKAMQRMVGDDADEKADQAKAETAREKELA